MKRAAEAENRQAFEVKTPSTRARQSKVSAEDLEHLVDRDDNKIKPETTTYQTEIEAAFTKEKQD